MKGSKSGKELHDFIFQQIADAELVFSHNAFEAFMNYASAQGFTGDQILTMAESGMSCAEILSAVEAGASTGQHHN